MDMVRSKISLNSFQLKIIAIITMLIDHVGAIFFPQYYGFRIIGRIAFPIFAFLLVEGYVHTSDIKKYLLRLGIFALISEFAFDLAFYGKILDFEHQNVFYTLFLGLVMLYLVELQSSPWMRMAIVILFMIVADFLKTDYRSIGLAMIFAFYVFRENLTGKIITVALMNIFLMGKLQAFGALALIPISLYNGKEGPKMKSLFYLFYPVHLLALFVINLVF